MGIFLFAKQIVDLLYQIKVLDIVMVLFAAGLIIYRVVKDKLYCDFKNRLIKSICFMDCCIIALIFIYGFSFLKDTGALNEAVKIESPFFIYFLGRLYYDRIKPNGRWLSLAGYIIIYANLIYSVAHQIYKNVTGNYFSWEPFGIDNGGALYYYKTDLALGIIFAVIFIYAFSKLKVFKWITILVPTVLTLVGTKARMGQLMLAIILFMVFCSEIASWFRNRKFKNETSITAENSDSKLTARIHETDMSDKVCKPDENLARATVKKINIAFAVLLTLIVVFFIAIQFSPVKATDYYGTGVSTELDDKIENIFHSRHVIYWDTLHFIANENVIYQFLGNDLTSFPAHNQRGMMSHCLYINSLYSAGYIGLIVLLLIPYRVLTGIAYMDDKKMKMAVLLVWTTFLIFGFTTDSLISTQFSWFPFIFAGAVTTEYQKAVTADK